MIERRKHRPSNGSDKRSHETRDAEAAKSVFWKRKRIYLYLLLGVPVVWLLSVLTTHIYVDVEKVGHEAASRSESKRDVRDDVPSTGPVEDVGYEEIKSWKRNDDTGGEFVVVDSQDVSANAKQHKHIPQEPKKKRKAKVLYPHPGLGEAGAASIIDASLLNEEERRAFEQGDAVHHFNEFVSDKISLHRAVPDFRNQDCQAAHPFYPKDLPPVSVIICFYNEAWSTLLRTIHSVLDRTPVHLLEEILLVDDGSDMDDLGDPLDEYISGMPKVHLIRTNQRLGLVRSRIMGIKQSKGTVLVFLDSHCECGYGWLEPLLAPIKADPSAVVTPTIDVIDKDDFRINNADNNIGGFSAESMTFNWINVPPRINRLRKTLADPFVSPTLAGGLFAINKEYFESLGLYDTGLEVWGGENLELSLKLWMCGGKIYISPCSRVGHIFRLKSPYVNVGDQFLSKNAARVAEVWLDEYKWFHFKANPYLESNFGDIAQAKKQRSLLKCKHFDWYLETIYPELFISGSGDYFGYVTHAATGLCLSSPTWDQKLELLPCNTGTVWEFNKMLEVRHDVYCLEYYPELPAPHATRCTQEQTIQVWSYHQTESTFYHHFSNSCLTVTKNNTVALEACNLSPSQKWLWPNNPHFKFNRTAAIEITNAAGW